MFGGGGVGCLSLGLKTDSDSQALNGSIVYFDLIGFVPLWMMNNHCILLINWTTSLIINIINFIRIDFKENNLLVMVNDDGSFNSYFIFRDEIWELKIIQKLIFSYSSFVVEF